MSKSSEHNGTNTPVDAVIAEARRQARAWTDLTKNLESCLVQAFGTTEVLPDPFRIHSIVAGAERNPALRQAVEASGATNLKAWISQQCSAIEQTFESRLRALCDANSIKLDGRFPSYLLAGFLRLHANLATGSCDLGDKHVETLLVDSLAPAILEAIKEEASRPFDKGKFIGELFSAYSRATALSKTVPGSALPIKDVFLELVIVKQTPKFAKAPFKSNFQEYPKEFFLRDLAKLIGAGSLATTSAKRLVLAPSAFSADAFPIIEAGAVRYIGRIAFSDSPE